MHLLYRLDEECDSFGCFTHYEMIAVSKDLNKLKKMVSELVYIRGKRRQGDFERFISNPEILRFEDYCIEEIKEI